MHRTVSRFSKEKDEISSGTASCTWTHLSGYEEALSYCLRARTKSLIQTCAKDNVMRVMNQNKTTIGSKHAPRLLVEETKVEYPFYVLNSWLTPNRVISSPTIPQKCAAIWYNERDFHNLFHAALQNSSPPTHMHGVSVRARSLRAGQSVLEAWKSQRLHRLTDSRNST